MEHFDERPTPTPRPSDDGLIEEIELEMGRQGRTVVIGTVEADMRVNLIGLLREMLMSLHF